MSKIGIIINSSGRPDGVRTTAQMPSSWKDFTVIAVPYDQAKAYRRHNDWPVMRIPSEVPQYLSYQRQWAIENMPCYNAVWFMDDDLRFQCRRTEGDVKLSTCTREELKTMLRTVEDTVYSENIPLVGISAVFGNNRVEETHKDICRVSGCYCIRKRVFRKVGATFLYGGLMMQDFHVILTFLENGYRNRSLYTFAYDAGASNTPGGCSVYRNEKTLAASAKRLAQLHPKSVTVQRKKTKHSWQGFEKDKNGMIIRTDVVVQWKKAYVPKRKKNEGIARLLS